MLKRQFLFFFLFTSLFLSGQDKDCLAFQGKGETFNKIRLDTHLDLLFTFTSEKMRSYLNGKEAIEAQAGLTYLESGFYILNLKIKIAIANATQLYGSLPVRSQINFYFLDKSQVKLRTSKKVLGIFEEKEKAYLYQTEHPLDANTIKSLKTKELDKISIAWSTGKEEYEVYDVDFFIRQFECLARYQ